MHAASIDHFSTFEFPPSNYSSSISVPMQDKSPQILTAAPIAILNQAPRLDSTSMNILTQDVPLFTEPVYKCWSSSYSSLLFHPQQFNLGELDSPNSSSPNSSSYPPKEANANQKNRNNNPLLIPHYQPFTPSNFLEWGYRVWIYISMVW